MKKFLLVAMLSVSAFILSPVHNAQAGWILSDTTSGTLQAQGTMAPMSGVQVNVQLRDSANNLLQSLSTTTDAWGGYSLSISQTINDSVTGVNLYMSIYDMNNLYPSITAITFPMSMPDISDIPSSWNYSITTPTISGPLPYLGSDDPLVIWWYRNL